MDILIRGRSETITLYRARGITLTSAVAYDPATGLTAGLTLTCANDATAAALLSAATKQSETIYATGLTVGKRYQILGTDGRALDVTAVAVAGTTVTLASKLPYAIAAGTAYGLQSTIVLTVPSTYTSRLIEIEATFSDGLVQQFSRLIGSRRIVVPITSEDVLTRYPRLRNRAQGELGFDAQITDVVDRARDDFWMDGDVLDDIRAPGMLKNYLLAEIGLQLLAAGYDLSAGGDAYESRRQMMDLRDREMTMLKTSPNLWIDRNEDRLEDDGETGPVGGIRLNWRNRE